jgi:hypothetical protein
LADHNSPTRHGASSRYPTEDVAMEQATAPRPPVAGDRRRQSRPPGRRGAWRRHSSPTPDRRATLNRLAWPDRVSIRGGRRTRLFRGFARLRAEIGAVR